MSDFNFNLDNTIYYEIQDKYLPVRAMTSDDMGILGAVAIIGCNPIIYCDYGGKFEITEYDDTEYFVFPKYSPLYNELVNKVLSMDSWIPKANNYFTIKGWIHGELRIVHIDKNLYYKNYSIW